MRNPEQQKPSESKFRLLLHYIKAGLHVNPQAAAELVAEYFHPPQEVTEAREAMVNLKEQLRIEPTRRSAEVIALSLTKIASSLVDNQAPRTTHDFWKMIQSEPTLLSGDAFLFDQMVKCLLNYKVSETTCCGPWQVPGARTGLSLSITYVGGTFKVMDVSGKKVKHDQKVKFSLHRIGVLCSEKCETEHNRSLWK